jgi:hypothetical protein
MVGCDFAVYSVQTLLKPKILSKVELKELTSGNKMRIQKQDVYVDAHNPTVGKNRKGEAVNYYLKIEKDERKEEDV